MSKLTSSAARTTALRPRKPPRTGKCLVRLRTDNSGAGAAPAAPASGDPAAAAQAILPAAISGTRKQAETPPVSVGISGGAVLPARVFFWGRGGQRAARGGPGAVGGRPFKVFGPVAARAGW